MKISKVTLCGPAEPSELFEFNPSVIFPKGYGGRPVNSLAKALVENGIKVEVVSISPHVDTYWTYSQGNLRLHLLPMRKRIRSVALDFFKHERNAMSMVLNNVDSDIIHAHWTYEFAMASLKANKQILITAHDAPLKIFRMFRDPLRLIRLLMSIYVRIKAKNISFVSPYLLRQWKVEMLWFRKSKVVPNISPFQDFSKSVPPYLKSSKELDPKVLIISDGSKLKNVRTALKAWDIVLEFLPKATLDLVGNGLESTGLLSTWAKTNNLDRQITWHGYLGRDEIAQKLRSARLLVHPSLEESQGLVLLEAMAFGVPVVAGKYSGGVPWTVGEGGILVDIRRPDEIANAILLLLQNNDLHENLGNKGFSRVLSVFSTSEVTKLYMEEYQRIINES
jgi:glycosyltransferase involved in cell wall biosynthesis